jgi:hypothetical protein
MCVVRKNYDFSKGVKNPYAEELKKGCSVTVHHDFIKKDGGKTGKNESAKD